MSVRFIKNVFNTDYHIQQNVIILVQIEEMVQELGRLNSLFSFLLKRERNFLIRIYYVLLQCQGINDNNTPCKKILSNTLVKLIWDIDERNALGQRSMNFFLCGAQMVNILGSWAIWSLLQLLNSVIANCRKYIDEWM